MASQKLAVPLCKLECFLSFNPQKEHEIVFDLIIATVSCNECMKLCEEYN